MCGESRQRRRAAAKPRACLVPASWCGCRQRDGGRRNSTIHASAVLVGAKAVLIRGPSGSGKSRLAWNLVTAATRGPVTLREAGCRRPRTPRMPLRTADRASSAGAQAGMIEIRGPASGGSNSSRWPSWAGRRSRRRRRRPHPGTSDQQHCNRRDYASAPCGRSETDAARSSGFALPPAGH